MHPIDSQVAILLDEYIYHFVHVYSKKLNFDDNTTITSRDFLGTKIRTTSYVNYRCLYLKIMIWKQLSTTPALGFPRSYGTVVESNISHSSKLVFERFEKSAWIYTAYNVHTLQI